MNSPGFENVLFALRHRPHRFPGHWAPEPRRVGESGGQNLPAWLREQVRKELQHRRIKNFTVDQELALLKECAAEDNMGVFANLDCDGKTIRYASIQVLIARTRSLEDSYRAASPELTYVRLDYEPGGHLEELFKTPLPHIHVEPHGEPRIPLESMRSGNLVLDFFDWVYRTYLHPTWRAWAHATFDEALKQRGNPPNPWAPIEQAFLGKGKLPLLRAKFAPELTLLKRTLRAKKDRAFPLRVDQADCDLVAYVA